MVEAKTLETDFQIALDRAAFAEKLGMILMGGSGIYSAPHQRGCS
jgi:hypothetical protein